MPTLREMITKWRYDVDTSGLRRAESQLGKIGKRMREVDPGATAVKGGALSNAMTSIAGGFTAMRAAWFGASAALGGAAVGMGMMTNSILRNAGAMEQHEIAFGTLLKSTERAKKLIGDIQSFAIKTPFEQAELIDAARTLLGFGTAAEDVMGNLQRLGDIAAGVGKERLPALVRAFGKMQLKGRVSLEELNIMIEAGVPLLKQLASQAGVSTEALYKSIEQGKVRFEDVNKAITALTTGSGLFANMMVNQSKSLFAVFSNISDYFQVLSTQIGQAVLPIVKELAIEFLAWVEANREWIKTQAVEQMTLMAEGAKGLLSAFKAMSPYFKAAVGYLGGFAGFLKEIWKISPVRQALSMADSIKRLAASFGLLQQGSMLGKIFDGLLWGIKKAAKAISIFIRLPSLLLEDFASFMEGKDSVFGRVLGFFTTLAQHIADTFKQAVSAPVQFIVDIIKWLNHEIGLLFGKSDGLIKKLPFSDTIRKGWDFFSGMMTNPFLPGVGQALTLAPQAGIGPSMALQSSSGYGPQPAPANVSITHNNTINANGLTKDAAGAMIDEFMRRKSKEDLTLFGDIAGPKIRE